ncbi:uncharacterized protein LOC116933126 [Daphnia magna]|uniref:uncharacterized protein LOC116933126 n=1 Tax=Daphnia magna TaxID=35525 RepID=UPI0014026C5F|nr:uncharacterized protein LOC116933126 [Daphnia magna]
MGETRLDTSQRMEQTAIALQTMQKELNVLAETSQHLAKTMFTVWILTTAKLDETARCSAEISQQLAETNDVTLNLRKALNGIPAIPGRARPRFSKTRFTRGSSPKKVAHERSG